MECSSWDSDNHSHTIESLRSFIQWHLEKALSFQFEFGQTSAPCAAAVDGDDESSKHNLNSVLGTLLVIDNLFFNFNAGFRIGGKLE